jgi:hypothetical protein
MDAALLAPSLEKKMLLESKTIWLGIGLPAFA